MTRLDFILRAVRKPLKDLKEGLSRSDLHFWKITLAAEWSIRPSTHTFSGWFTMDSSTCQGLTAQTFGTTLQLHLEPVLGSSPRHFGILYWGSDIINRFQLSSPEDPQAGRTQLCPLTVGHPYLIF